ncbi:MAG: GntR family transcriptional regulator [Oscillospiraceae bacterium]|nr:GntR family transcriptional regulator [Oscillospiraceae bacterium]
MKIYQNSNEPIYKQIASQLRDDILAGRLAGGDPLPSIRSLAQDLKISVITTMKAYEELVSEGLVVAAKGQGYYVNAGDRKMLEEQHRREVEQHLSDAIRSARIAGMTEDEICEVLRTLWALED